MKIRRFNLTTMGVIAGYALLCTTIACNNSDKQGTNSTITDTVINTDTTTAVPDNTRNGDTTMKNGDTATHHGMKTDASKKIGHVTVAAPTIDKAPKMNTDAKGYYNYTETAPSFPGGQGSLENYMTNNVEYPQEAIDNDVEGTVQVMFTIDENGKVGNAKTTGTKLGYGLEDEAIRVVNGMSAWTPGMVKGKKVKGWYTLPITFRLE